MMKVWTAVLVCGAMVSVVAWAMALLRENGVCPFAAVTRFVRGLPWFGRVAVLPLFVALIAYGSVKQSSMDANHKIHETHEIDGRDMNQGFNAEAQSRGDAQRGEDGDFYHAEESGGDGIVENAVIAEDWLKFGGYEDWIYIGPGDWSFRYGSNFVERLAAFSSGKIRVLGNGGGDAILSLAGTPVSIAPKANWGSLGGAESCFWHAETPSNTLVLTWQNALLNRDSNSLVNIQAELFSSGEMRVTHDLSGEVETEYLPALPYPETDTVDELLARIDPDHTNAYFFAEVCVAKGPSKIDVRCEGGSLLGDYSVMAYPGETNRLPMLIGPKYEVKGEAAFEHFAVQQEEVAVTNLTDRVVEVRWPVKFMFEEQYAPGGYRMFSVMVEPSFLEGEVVWDNAASQDVGMRTRSARSGGCSCNCASYTNNTVTISVECNCNPCTHSGKYEYEGHFEPFDFDYYPEEEEGEDPENPEEPEEPPDEPSASAGVSFDKSAIIFEDEYENAPGQFVARRSTRAKLKCGAYGGRYGGMLEVDLSRMNGLKLVSGTPPTSREIGPYETVDFEAEYEGETASSHENGTVARVTFTENETKVKFDDDAEITVVEVTFSPTKIARDNMLPGRHKLGVCEVVACSQEPNMPLVNWVAEHGYFHLEGSMHYFHCPLHATENPIKAMIEDIELLPNISVQEPERVIAKNVSFKDYGVHPGSAGYVGMELDVYISPFDVSFEEIDVEEVPNENGSHVGYFASPYFSNVWYHTSGNGAGKWIKIKEDNYFGRDLAAYTKSISKVYLTGLEGENTIGWYYGYMVWHIPYGWRSSQPKESTILPYKHFAQDTRQEYTLESNGTLTISKLNCWVSRSTNEVIMIYGEE